jgi:hypothetical protein
VWSRCAASAGSIGTQGAARSALLLARDPGEEARRVLCHFKCNVGPEQPSLLYALDPILLLAMNGAPDVGRFAWSRSVRAS